MGTFVGALLGSLIGCTLWSVLWNWVTRPQVDLDVDGLADEIVRQYREKIVADPTGKPPRRVKLPRMGWFRLPRAQRAAVQAAVQARGLDIRIR